MKRPSALLIVVNWPGHLALAAVAFGSARAVYLEQVLVLSHVDRCVAYDLLTSYSIFALGCGIRYSILCYDAKYKVIIPASHGNKLITGNKKLLP